MPSKIKKSIPDILCMAAAILMFIIALPFTPLFETFALAGTPETAISCFINDMLQSVDANTDTIIDANLDDPSRP